MSDSPFDSIESAHEFVTLLREHVSEVRGQVDGDIAEASAGRRLDALRLVDYKLGQLGSHLAGASRVLNDLRALRRLLLTSRTAPAAAAGTESEVEAV